MFIQVNVLLLFDLNNFLLNLIVISLQNDEDEHYIDNIFLNKFINILHFAQVNGVVIKNFNFYLLFQKIYLFFTFSKFAWYINIFLFQGIFSWNTFRTSHAACKFLHQWMLSGNFILNFSWVETELAGSNYCLQDVPQQRFAQRSCFQIVLTGESIFEMASCCAALYFELIPTFKTSFFGYKISSTAIELKLKILNSMIVVLGETPAMLGQLALPFNPNILFLAITPFSRPIFQLSIVLFLNLTFLKLILQWQIDLKISTA